MFVIAGVSGNTGSVAADTLLDKGRKVRVIVRNAAQGERFRARGAEVAVASLEDHAAVAKALEGAEGAYFLSPPNFVAEDYLASSKAVVDGIARAVETSNVPHVVFLSSTGAHLTAGSGIIISVHHAEERLARTAAKLTFVRAAYFIDNWGGSLAAASTGKLPTFLLADRKMPMVAARDIGALAATALLEGPPSSRISVINLEGPEEYSPRDIAAAAARIVGRPVEPDFGPDTAIESAFRSFGASADVARLYRELIVGVNTGKVVWENKGERHVRGATDANTVVRTLLTAKA